MKISQKQNIREIIISIPGLQTGFLELRRVGIIIGTVYTMMLNSGVVKIFNVEGAKHFFLDTIRR